MYPFQTLLSAGSSGLAVDSKAQAEQIRSVAVERLVRRIGTVPIAVLHDLEEAIRLHLAL